jgi:hypothetical protein
MKPILFHLAFLLVLLPAQTLGGEDSTVQFLPGTKLFRRFTADALGHGISVSRIVNDRDWIGTIGASVPLVTVRPPGEIELQFSAAVTTFNRLIKPPGLTVYTIDYRVDIPIDARMGSLAVRFAYGHYSCHFADDGIEIIGKRSIQSLKDFLWMGCTYDIAPLGGHVYAAGYYFYNNYPRMDKRWQFQGGIEGGNVTLADFVKAYAAIDLKFKQEVNWGTTRSFQLGLRLFQRSSYGMRVAYTLRQGFDERGQFFDKTEDASMFSLFIDL